MFELLKIIAMTIPPQPVFTLHDLYDSLDRTIVFVSEIVR